MTRVLHHIQNFLPFSILEVRLLHYTVYINPVKKGENCIMVIAEVPPRLFLLYRISCRFHVPRKISE